MTLASLRTPRSLVRACALTALALAIAVSALVSGCGPDEIDLPPVNVERPAPAKKPRAADLTTPESAVRSYLDYVSYAYLKGSSDVASQTMSLDELARIDGYIGLDQKRGRKLEQKLTSIKFGTPASPSADKTFVPAHVQWTYRYIDALSGVYKGSAKKASFDATYTVERGSAGWLVTSVEATASTPVQ